MKRPHPTLLFRLLHIDNLATICARGAVHAPNSVPNDGLPYSGIHRADVQSSRRPRMVRCGPRGTVGDYVSFYLGPRSPMLLQLKSGNVDVYASGQAPLVYLVSTVERVIAAGLRYAFTDRHSLATYAKWSDEEGDLEQLDWSTIYAKQWHKTINDPERQNRKQAEFLVHDRVPLSACHELAVVNLATKQNVEAEIALVGSLQLPPVVVRPEWYC